MYLQDLLSVEDTAYITNKEFNNIKCKIYGLYGLIILNTLLLFCICGVIIYYTPDINTIVNLVNKHKDEVDTTIHTLSKVSTKVDIISDTIINFKSIAKNKLLVTLCDTQYIRAILGSYFCSQNSTHIAEVMNHI